MNKILVSLAVFFISSQVMADQKTPIAPSLPAHSGTDLDGNKVIHNAPNQPAQEEEGILENNSKSVRKNKHK